MSPRPAHVRMKKNPNPPDVNRGTKGGGGPSRCQAAEGPTPDRRLVGPRPEQQLRPRGGCRGGRGHKAHAHPEPRCALNSACATPWGPPGCSPPRAPVLVSMSTGTPRTPGAAPARHRRPPPAAVTLTRPVLGRAGQSVPREHTRQGVLLKGGPSMHGGPGDVPKDRQPDRRVSSGRSEHPVCILTSRSP